MARSWPRYTRSWAASRGMNTKGIPANSVRPSVRPVTSYSVLADLAPRPWRAPRRRRHHLVGRGRQAAVDELGSPSRGLVADDHHVDRRPPSVMLWRAMHHGVAFGALDRRPLSAGMVAADVKAPEAPSRSSQPSAPKAATAWRGSRWNCSVRPVMRNSSAEHHGHAGHHGGEPGRPVLEVAEGEQQHPAARDRRTGSITDGRVGGPHVARSARALGARTSSSAQHGSACAARRRSRRRWRSRGAAALHPDVEVEVGDAVLDDPLASRTEARMLARTIVETRWGGPWPCAGGGDVRNPDTDRP